MKTNKPSIGTRLSPLLIEIEASLWDFEYSHPGDRPMYSIFGLRAALKIFMSTLLDAMWQKQEAKLVPQKEREKMATEAGQAIRQLVQKYIGIDTHKLYKI